MSKKLLVEYDYTEMNDRDIIKFINKGDLEIISNPWFITLMNFYWQSFAKKIFLSQFILALTYMILFFISSTLYTYNSIYYKDYINYTYSNITNQTVFDNYKKYNYDLLKAIYLFFDGVILIINTVYLVSEILEIKKLKKKKNLISYIFNKWNLFDNTQIFLVYATVVLKVFHNNYEKILIAILYPIFFLKFLKLLRGFRNIGPYIREL